MFNTYANKGSFGKAITETAIKLQNLSSRLARRKSRVQLSRGHMSERFFRSNRPGYPHPVSSELENSGIGGR